MTRRLNIDVDDLVKRYEAGASVKELADVFGCARNVVVKRLGERGITQRNRSEAMFLRQAQMSVEERKALLAKAHKAARGRIHSEEESVRRAKTRFERQLGISHYAVELGQVLTELGIGYFFEYPVGPYNLDFALQGNPVAVELHGGGWHTAGSHARRRPKRLEYLFSCGWTVVEVWCVNPTWKPLAVAKQIYSIAEVLSTDPADVSQHWMLRCDGDVAPALRSYGYDVAAVCGASRRDNSSGRYLRIT